MWQLDFGLVCGKPVVVDWPESQPPRDYILPVFEETIPFEPVEDNPAMPNGTVHRLCFHLSYIEGPTRRRPQTAFYQCIGDKNGRSNRA